MNHWLISLAALCLLFPVPSRAGEQPKSEDKAHSSELPFQLASGYLIQVEGRIGEQRNLNFILDTGASISMVDQRLAGKLKLDSHPATSFNFDRNLAWKTATVSEVQFGPVHAANVVVLVGNLSRYSEFASKTDAVIGMDLLGLRDVTIDFDARKLIFDPSMANEYLAGGDPMSKCIMVALQVQDHPVHLIVDTGVPGILLYEDRLRKQVPGLRTAGAIKSATMGGRVPVKQATLPDVVLGNRNRDVPVVFLPAPADDTLQGIAGIAGISALQAHRVHFDFSRKTLSWE